MKAVCSILFFLLFSCSYAQEKSALPENDTTLIGQCMDGTIIHASLSYKADNYDTTYILSLRNLQANADNDYHNIAFPGSKTSVNQLYQVIKFIIASRNRKHKDYTTTIALGNKMVVIAATRILGVTSVIIYLPEGYNYLTERQADKVFGKI